VDQQLLVKSAAVQICRLEMLWAQKHCRNITAGRNKKAKDLGKKSEEKPKTQTTESQTGRRSCRKIIIVGWRGSPP
jgi:hypothetical protein